MPTFLGAAVGLCKIVCFLKGGKFATKRYVRLCV